MVVPPSKRVEQSHVDVECKIDACSDLLKVILTKVSLAMKGGLPDICIGYLDLQCDAFSFQEHNAATAVVTFSIFCVLRRP